MKYFKIVPLVSHDAAIGVNIKKVMHDGCLCVQMFATCVENAEFTQ
jgi:hypothetical protein